MHDAVIRTDKDGRASLDISRKAHPDLLAALEDQCLSLYRRDGPNAYTYTLYPSKDVTPGHGKRPPLHKSGEFVFAVRPCAAMYRLTVGWKWAHPFTNHQKVKFAFAHPHLTIFTET